MVNYERSWCRRVRDVMLGRIRNNRTNSDIERESPAILYFKFLLQYVFEIVT